MALLRIIGGPNAVDDADILEIDLRGITFPVTGLPGGTYVDDGPDEDGVRTIRWIEDGQQGG